MGTEDGMDNLMNAVLGALGGGALATNNLYQDVVVVPTTSQIDDNTDLVDDADIAEDTICSICQHHVYQEQSGSPDSNSSSESTETNSTEESTTQTQWRRLHCDHEFHKPCVDRWFTQSVFCPVCRYDVRNVD
jgi:hypothetical protein